MKFKFKEDIKVPVHLLSGQSFMRNLAYWEKNFSRVPGEKNQFYLPGKIGDTTSVVTYEVTSDGRARAWVRPAIILG